MNKLRIARLLRELADEFEAQEVATIPDAEDVLAASRLLLSRPDGASKLRAILAEFGIPNVSKATEEMRIGLINRIQDAE